MKMYKKVSTPSPYRWLAWLFATINAVMVAVADESFATFDLLNYSNEVAMSVNSVWDNVSNEVKFTITTDKVLVNPNDASERLYFAFGLRSAESTFMNDMDTFFCFEGESRVRYGSSGTYGTPANPVSKGWNLVEWPTPDPTSADADFTVGTCQEASDKRTMIITLPTTGSSSPDAKNRVSLTPGTPQTVIYAYGDTDVLAFDAATDLDIADILLMKSTLVDINEQPIDAGASKFRAGPLTVSTTITDTEGASGSGESSSDIVRFDVTGGVAGKWIAIAFSETSTMLQSDVFWCGSGDTQVFRTRTLDYAPPAKGIVVEGSECNIGTGTMSFSRAVGTGAAGEVALTPGTAQVVNWATGGSALNEKHESKGSVLVDVASADSGGVVLRTGEYTLYLHLVFMILSWGALLPWGVALAVQTKKLGTDGAWYRLHRNFQIVGWVCQLIGFGFAISHCQVNSTHFANYHTYVGIVAIVLGTLQPTAILRPGKTDPKTTKRKVWEVLHKGLGYVAILLGIVSICLGIAVATLVKGYDMSVLAVAVSLFVASMLFLLIFIISTCIKSENSFAIFCAGKLAKPE